MRLGYWLGGVLAIVCIVSLVGCKTTGTAHSATQGKPGLMIYLPESAMQLRQLATSQGLDIQLVKENSESAPLLRAFLNVPADGKEYFAVVNTQFNRIVTGGVVTDEIDEAQRQQAFAKLKKISEAGKNADATLTPEAGKVRLVVFSDYQCPFCKQMDGILQTLETKYSKDLDVKMMHYPLPMHPYAMPAAEAAECARNQEKFDAYSEALFKEKTLSLSSIKTLAQSLKLDTKTFDACLSTHQTQSKVVDSQLLGQYLGVAGTPSLFLNGEPVALESPEKLDALIDEKIKAIKH